jgi:hypothetical protein
VYSNCRRKNTKLQILKQINIISGKILTNKAIKSPNPRLNISSGSKIKENLLLNNYLLEANSTGHVTLKTIIVFPLIACSLIWKIYTQMLCNAKYIIYFYIYCQKSDRRIQTSLVHLFVNYKAGRETTPYW